MTKPEDIDALIERVKGLSGPDRELDVDLAWALEPLRYRNAYWNGRAGKPGTTLPLKLDGMGRSSVRANCPSFTASIDAALALVERVLPGQWLEMINRAFELMWVEYAPKAPLDHLPRFIILALLTAILNRGENQGD